MIATRRPQAYLTRVPFMRLVRFFTILALLLAPLVMSGGHAAPMAPAATTASHHEAMQAGHCAGMEDEDQQDEPRPDIDCTIACSGLPAVAGGLGERLAVRKTAMAAPAPSSASGLHPESDPPPPRA